MLLRYVFGGIVIILLGVVLPKFTWFKVEYTDFLFWKIPITVVYHPFAWLEIPLIIIGIIVLAYGLLKTED